MTILLTLGVTTPIPVNTAAPVITGTEVEGEELSCSTGTWDNNPTSYTYQWEREGTPIGGATNNTYTLQAADVGNTLTCVVTAYNAGGSASAESDPTGTIAAPNPVVGSLDFEDTSTQYLSMTAANWGAYDRAKFAIAGSFRLEANGKEQVIINRDVSNASNEFFLYVGSGNNIGFTSNNGAAFFTGPGSAFTTATWYSFLVHFDSANATSTDRIKIWINNSAVTASGYTAPSGSVPTLSTDTEIGRRKAFSGSSYFDGLLYSMAFFDGVLPSPAEVFNGSAGKLNDLSGISGLKSLLTGSTATDDYLLTDWTNNGTVTTSATVP